jgi:hypothetical protein
MPAWKKVIVSGSNASLASLTVTGGVTGSLFGTASYATQALSASYAPNTTFPYTGSAIISGSLNVIGPISNVNYIDFNTGSAVPAWKSGRVFWDNTDGALSVYNAEADITLQVGQENWVRVYNASGVLIQDGTPVKLVGSHGDVPEIQLAQSVQVSGSIEKNNQILGLATHDIEINTIGYVTIEGLVKGLNTNAFSDGDRLFVSSSAGKITNIPPLAPYEVIPVGVVVKAGPGGSGIIYVNSQQPLDFSDLSSVLVSGSYHSGDLWVYNQPLKRWEHTNQLSGSYAVTGSWSATSFTGSLFGTASYATQALSASYIPTLHQVTSQGNSTTNAITASGLFVTGNTTLVGNLNVYGTSSFTYVTSSQLNVDDSFISVNVFEPAERFGGLKVYDSGSSTATASLAWDSLHNHWVYQNVDGSTYTGGMFLSGPRNTGSLGDEPNLTKWFIPRSDGGDHLDNSQIFTSGSITIVTGSLTATTVTGSNVKITGLASSSDTRIVVSDTAGNLSYTTALSLQGTTGTQGIQGTAIQGTTGTATQGATGTQGIQGFISANRLARDFDVLHIGLY